MSPAIGDCAFVRLMPMAPTMVRARDLMSSRTSRYSALPIRMSRRRMPMICSKDPGPARVREDFALHPVGLHRRDDDQLVAGEKDLVDEVVEGLPEPRVVLGQLEVEIEMPLRVGHERHRLLPALDGRLPDEVDGVEGLEPAVLVDLEVGDGQVVDEPVPLEHADRDLDVEGRRFVAKDLGGKRRRGRERQGRQEAISPVVSSHLSAPGHYTMPAGSRRPAAPPGPLSRGGAARTPRPRPSGCRPRAAGRAGWRPGFPARPFRSRGG